MHVIFSHAIFTALWSLGATATGYASPTTMAASVTPQPKLNNRQIPALSIVDSLSSSMALGTLSFPSQNTTNATASSAIQLPSPTGSPLEFPDDDTGDCNPDVYIGNKPGDVQWKAANATWTINCFEDYYAKNPNFDGDERYDRALAHYWGYSTHTFKCGFDSQACQMDTGCKDLMPYPLLPNQSDASSKLPSYCQVTDSRVHNKATGWVVMQSMMNYNTYLQSIFQQVQRAADTVDPNMGVGGPFMKSFGTPPPDTVTPMKQGLTALTALIGVIAGSIGIITAGMGEPVTAAVIGAIPYISGVIASAGISGATTNMTAATNPDDMYKWWGNLKLSVYGGYQTYADTIFADGYMLVNRTPPLSPYNATLLEIFEGGVWLNGGGADYNVSNATSMDFVEQSFYAQMAQTVWQLSDQVTPFISVWDGDCTDHNKLPPNFMVQWKQGQASAGNNADKMNWTDVSASIGGQCYSLLGAQSGECIDQYSVHSKCCQWDVLQSGTVTALNGTDWSGLKLTDMIESAVSGWKLNNQVNGYDQSTLISTVLKPGFPKKLSDPGVVNLLPICDYGKNASAPGLGCPNTMNNDRNAYDQDGKPNSCSFK